jgi:hypothetical protein
MMSMNYPEIQNLSVYFASLHSRLYGNPCAQPPTPAFRNLFQYPVVNANVTWGVSAHSIITPWLIRQASSPIHPGIICAITYLRDFADCPSYSRSNERHF